MELLGNEYFNGVIQGVLGSIIVACVIFLFNALVYTRHMKPEVISQFHLLDMGFSLDKRKNFKVKNLPFLLEEYFLYIDNRFLKKTPFTIKSNNPKIEIVCDNTFNFEVSLGTLRVSTFFVFTDNENVLILRRSGSNAKQQEVLNIGFDCHGAFSFNNATLYTKLPIDFLDEKVLSVELIPGLAIEKNGSKFLGLFESKYSNSVVMLGFKVLVKPNSLNKAVGGLNEKHSLSNIDLSALNVTSKASLAINYLKNS